MSLSNGKMGVARSAWRLSVAVVCFALAGWLAAGEPIKFSTTEKKLEPAKPMANPLERYLDRPFESLRPESSLGPVMPFNRFQPTVTPALPDKNEREKANWQNSWIFALPEQQNRQPTAEEVFKVERMGPDGRPLPKPTLMDQYFQHREGRRLNPGPNPPMGSGNANNPERNAQGNRWRDRDPSDPGAEQEDSLGMRRPGDNPSLRSILDTDSSRNSLGNRGVARETAAGEFSLHDMFKESREEMKQERLREEKRQDYRLMLESRNYHDLQQGRKDAQMGLTTPGMNAEPLSFQPRAMRELGAYNRESRPALSLTPPAEPLSGRSPRSSLFDNSRPGGGALPSASSANPITEPARDPASQRERPSVLPVPKRQF